MDSYWADDFSEDEMDTREEYSHSFEHEAAPNTSKTMDGVLYWSNETNRNEKRLKGSLRRLFFKHPKLEGKYKNQSEDIDDQLNLFLRDFFLENIPLAYFVANLSIKDQAEERINLAIRIPNHGEFLNDLPSTSAICIRGYWGVMQRNPVFVPEDIFTSFNDEGAADYEVELLASASSLRPERYCTDNILTPELADKLPAISVKAAEKLKDWQEFLNFKRQLIDRKTIGLRYLEHSFDQQSNLQFLVMAEREQLISQADSVFKRKDLEAFELGISQDQWRFELNFNDKFSRIPRGEQLGHLKGRIKKLKVTETKKYSKHLTLLHESGIDKPILAYVTIEPSEDWKNKLDNALKEIEITEDNETQSASDLISERKQVEDALLSAIPEQGFISFPSVGDLTLIKRQEQTIKNLRQNENCYSPYLSSYMFDISKAGASKNDTTIESWFNEQLNAAQKQAVNKMVSAPDLCLVQGPPGTGKTTVIAEAILQLARNGETVLLASQSHDAIDNALSCIRNRPELRAIRLARGHGKITEEGKAFAEDKALGRYYSSLHDYAKDQWLIPQQKRDEEFTQLKMWIESAKYVVADLQSVEDQLNRQYQQKKFVKDSLAKEQQAYDDSVCRWEVLSSQIDATNQSMVNLQNEKLEIISDSFLPIACTNLIVLLQQMKEQNIDIEEHFLAFEDFDNPASSALVLNALLAIWSRVKEILPALRTDLLRLQSAGSESLKDDLTQEKITQLEIREENLAAELETNDSEELFVQWREVRAEIRVLQNQAAGLDIANYQCFTDRRDIVNVKNAAQTYQLMSNRIGKLDGLKQEVDIVLQEVIDQQNQWLKQNKHIPKPSSDALRKRQKALQITERDLATLNESLQAHKSRAAELLSARNLDSTRNLDECLREANKDYQDKMDVAIEFDKKHAPWRGFLHDWTANLSIENSAQRDWEHVSQTFLESCNLVAISCNESDKTLKDAGIESFDTVIIDEVSKATPVELLLPLMRARKAVLVGDHRQLPPVFQESQDAQAFTDKIEEYEDDDTETLLTRDNLNRFEKMVTASLFKEHFENADSSIKERLTTQYRMHPKIMNFVNYFYDGQLLCGNPEKDRSHNILLKSKHNTLLSHKDHVLWVDTSLDFKGNVFKENQDRTNRLEAILIARTLVEINQQCAQQGFDKHNKQVVGVVSFYAAQCRVIRDEIKKVNNGKIQFDAIHVEINTVIRYQGKEKPIILISLVRNDGGPKHKRRSAKANVARFEFINVAMSRAQNLLIMFGARNMLELRDVWLPNMDKPGKQKKQVYRQFFAQLDRQASIFSAAEMTEHFDGTYLIGKGAPK
ncbi:AAA domain-containing protein [Thalassotalea ponticola]|uniref:DEAD/DEAH box helicase n=1 Tax=Thalassotalea ponticola TaxID=1523392 RepID=UPI0025B35584|nr:AAA domain-containing protein [Thalassotalea ponticola]MDN3651344.1 AAA domain-containing protein [Thalassotalea ponticola]